MSAEISPDDLATSTQALTIDTPCYAKFLTCANLTTTETDAKRKNCTNAASMFCGRCHLVKYCSKGCQTEHWPQHKQDCNHPLRKADWMPTWHKENRQPTFVGGPPQETFGHLRYLWGNMPAYDVLRLEQNEGLENDKDISLCFAASGDLRNVIITINSLPSKYQKSCTSVLNDRDGVVVARNVILLLLALYLHPEEASEAMLHVWYSARLTPKVAGALQEKIKPMVADVVNKIQSKDNITVLSKTWASGSASVSVCLFKSQWMLLLKTLEATMSLKDTEERRKYVILNRSRLDVRERVWYNLTPGMRLCAYRFRESGVLLPFGHCLDEYTVPNTTLFDLDTGDWLQKDSSTVIDGYDLGTLLEYAQGRVPKDDLNGRQFCYILDMLRGFCTKMHESPLRFVLYEGDAADLSFTTSRTLEMERYFDRIEVSNIADMPYLGLEAVLENLGPLLKRSSENCHATLITLFMNATHQAEQYRGEKWRLGQLSRVLAKVTDVLPLNSNLVNANHPETIKRSFAKDMVGDNDEMFAYYWTQMIAADGIAARCGMRERKKNKIIAKWPICQLPDPKERFLLLLKSGHVGRERYVEWTRKE